MKKILVILGMCAVSLGYAQNQTNAEIEKAARTLRDIKKESSGNALSVLKKYANQGNAYAAYYLGEVYEFGTGGVDKNITEAEKWYKKAVEKGDGKILFQVEKRYYRNNSYYKSVNEILNEVLNGKYKIDKLTLPYIGNELLIKSAEKGYYPAFEEMDFMIKNYADVDFSEELVQWKKLAEQGNARMQLLVGTVSKGEERKYWLEKSAEQGDAYAQYLLGKENSGFAIKALQWYRKSAEQGNFFAQKEVVDAYRFGEGVEESDAKAFELAMKYAEQGNFLVMKTIADMYDGRKEKSKYVEWLQKASDLGNNEATVSLAQYYQGEKDIKKAMEYYNKAQKNGMIFFQYSGLEYYLILRYEMDTGKKIQKQDIMDYLNKKLTTISYEKFMGDNYYYGQNGLEKSYTKAVEWYKKH